VNKMSSSSIPGSKFAIWICSPQEQEQISFSLFHILWMMRSFSSVRINTRKT
jgi:hypothetical protein